MITRKRSAYAIFFTGVLLLSGCSSSGAPDEGASDDAASSDAAEDLTAVNFSEAVHNLGYINLYVAMEKGFFEKNGIDLTVSAAGGDSQAFAAVLGGSADFAIGDSTLAEISVEGGGPGVILGEVVSRAQYFGVSTTITDPITDPADFEGLTFVTSPPPNTNYNILSQSLQRAGLSESDVTISTVNPGTEIGPVLAGQADIAVAYEPNVSSAVVGEDASVVYSWAEDIGPFHNTGMMALPEYVEANPEIVQGMVNAFQEGALYTYAHPDEAAEIAKKEFPDIEPAIVEAAIQRLIENEVPASSFVTSEEGWNALMAVGAGLGNCTCDVPFDQIIDNSFAEEAAETVTVSE